MGEFDRIDRFFRPLTAGFPGARGLVDDVAVIDPPPGQRLAVTTDALVEDIHFLGRDRPFDIARKALRCNLSDLAAKGADPLAYSLALALPKQIDDGWLADFCAGLAADQAAFGIALSGGDSVSTPGPIMVSITAFGLCPAGPVIDRAGAQPGDLVLVSGTLGDALLGLRVLRGELPGLDPADADWLAGRYWAPTPRFTLRPLLRGGATASLDISDGLLADLGHIAAASGVAIRVEAQAVPLSPAARGAGISVIDACTGGDDYEVALTVPPHLIDKFQKLADTAGIALALVGRCTAGPPGVTLVDELGRDITPARRGWVHF